MAPYLLTISGIIGLMSISTAIWIKKENRQDLLFIIGGCFLLIYSIGIGNIIFSILQVIFIISASIEIFKLKNYR